jgi:ATP-dependent DNA helicase PIF1
MRQRDAHFQDILSEVRNGTPSELTKGLLESLVGAKIGRDGIKPTKLYSLRKDVDEINRTKLEKLVTCENALVKFECKDNFVSKFELGEQIKNMHVAMINKDCQARPRLELAVGAQVMLIKNLDIEAGLVNGSRGVVTSFLQGRPIVKFFNGIEMIIKIDQWENKISDDVFVVRAQIPLILAFALTIHKVQGATLDCVKMNLGSSIFEYGQFYTALSRVRSLEGLSITELDFDKIKTNDTVLQFYKEL